MSAEPVDPVDLEGPPKVEVWINDRLVEEARHLPEFDYEGQAALLGRRHVQMVMQAESEGLTWKIKISGGGPTPFGVAEFGSHVDGVLVDGNRIPPGMVAAFLRASRPW